MSPDVLTQLELIHQQRYPQFFEQAGHVLLKEALSHGPEFDMSLFQDALKLSQAHFCNVYFERVSQQHQGEWDLSQQQLHLRYNLWDFYQATLIGQSLDLKSEATIYNFIGPSKK